MAAGANDDIRVSPGGHAGTDVWRPRRLHSPNDLAAWPNDLVREVAINGFPRPCPGCQAGGLVNSWALIRAVQRAIVAIATKKTETSILDGFIYRSSIEKTGDMESVGRMARPNDLIPPQCPGILVNPLRAWLERLRGPIQDEFRQVSGTVGYRFVWFG